MQTPTVSGIVGKYIGTAAKKFSAAMLIFIMLAVGTSQMVAVGTLGEALFGLEPTVSILVLGCGILLYTVLGGMMAVGYTNIMHMLVMYIGAILAVIVSATHVGGLQGLQQALPADYFSPLSIGTPKVISWVIASLLGACTAQAGLQPVLTAKDEKTARTSSFWIAAIVAPFGILMAVLGMIARVRFPDLANAKMALPTLMLSLPSWSGGFVIASIFAAILSTASPIFLAAGTLFTRDIYQEFASKKGECSDKHMLMVSRTATFVGGSICIVVAVFLGKTSTILDLVYFAYSLRGSMFIILLLGILWKRLVPKAAIAAMIATMAAGLIWIGYKGIYGVYPIHPAFSETYISIIVAFAVSVFGSLILKPQGSEELMNRS
jgi:SSS family solute:Na+ symporter